MTRKQLLFSFKGRISRSQYRRGYWLNWAIWALPLPIIGIYAGLEVVNAVSGNHYVQPPQIEIILESNLAKKIADLICAPFIIAGIWSFFALQVKRWHDLGLPAGMVVSMPGLIAASIPIITADFAQDHEEMIILILGLIVFFFPVILGNINGSPGPNKYGPRPEDDNDWKAHRNDKTWLINFEEKKK